ncbi:MAG TPA: response regulator [Thermoanaerobaculia bacterium]|nr:response regulator [Thermoanaerobaculia bacterium]
MSPLLMPGRVLVVDDEEPIRILIQRLLSKHGYSVETAQDGASAIDKIAHEDFDAVVLDLMMPRIDGFTVLRQLIDLNPDLVSRTVVATAYPKDVASRQLDEVCQVIIKPFDTLELVSAVEECVKRAAQ